VSNGNGKLSIERLLDVIPSLGIDSVLTEGTNGIARFILKRKMADILIHVLVPVFHGADIEGEDSGPDLISPRTVILGDTTVYYSNPA
jgi:riboflavin biosynthesis pyrimidine reductase